MPAKKRNTVIEPVHVKPFLKWAGSKRQLLQQFINIYPTVLKNGHVRNYYEPFLGSGAVFFDIAQRYTIENAFLCDVNEELILTYKTVQARAEKLIEVLYKHEKKYLSLDTAHRQAYFYDQRASFNGHRFDSGFTEHNAKGIARAAQLIFLNRTCFNGLFRVNSKGEFNTPAGDYIKPSICDENNLLAASKLLARADIRIADYNQALKRVRVSAFVYFDPPYRPVSKTASFTAYSKAVFGDKEQRQLCKLFTRLDKKGTTLMLSNSDCNDAFFDNMYQGFHVMRVPAKRLINADPSKRGLVNEIVVTNYPVG
ncbi:MAG: Dam family site-specific DNA-(adenine-N6)-methyltransferase [Chitinophagaceae bacterium]